MFDTRTYTLFHTRYPHSAYLQKHTVSHSLQLAGQLFSEAEGLMSTKRVSGCAVVVAVGYCHGCGVSSSLKLEL